MYTKLLKRPNINTISFLNGILPVVQRNNDVASILHNRNPNANAVDENFLKSMTFACTICLIN